MWYCIACQWSRCIKLHLKARDGDHRTDFTDKMRMTNHMRIIVQPYIFGLFVDHKVHSRWGKLGCRVYSKRRHYGIQCMEWCAVIGWADLSHSAEKGDWRLSRFGKKREKTWQNNTADIAFCIKFQIDFSISTRVNALDFLENKLFFLMPFIAFWNQTLHISINFYSRHKGPYI